MVQSEIVKVEVKVQHLTDAFIEMNEWMNAQWTQQC